MPAEACHLAFWRVVRGHLAGFSLIGPSRQPMRVMRQVCAALPVLRFALPSRRHSSEDLTRGSRRRSEIAFCVEIQPECVCLIEQRRVGAE